MFSSSIPSPDYSPVNDDEKGLNHSSTSDEGSEDDPFISNGTLLKRPRSIFQRQNWRIALEVLLLLSSLMVLAVALFYKPPLLKRQQECGRLLGQWRTFLSSLFSVEILGEYEKTLKGTIIV